MNRDLVGDIVQRIVEAAQSDRIILFGSRTRGDDRPDSDLVIKESNESGHRWDAHLYLNLTLAGLNAPVDVITYTPEEVRDWSGVPQAFITKPIPEQFHA
jgi:uncharacterized protein